MATHKAKRLSKLWAAMVDAQAYVRDPERLNFLKQDMDEVQKELADEYFRSGHPALHAEREKKKNRET